jgi:hypothetical protein
MAFVINIRSDHDPSLVWARLGQAIAASRFTADIRHGKVKRKDRKTYKAVLMVHEVRLRKTKVYYGNHPAACKNTEELRKRPFGGKALYLEGADWVGWNDLVNDVLDALGVDADVASSVCEIRIGRNRRIRYDYHVEEREYETLQGVETRSIPEWDRFGDSNDYGDYCGKPAPVTEYPEGTPGLAKWRADDGSEPTETPVPAAAGV